MDEPQILLVFTTTPSSEVAASLVEALVGEGLAACGTILPNALSIYRWNGTLESAAEAQVILKTTTARVTELRRRFTELHPYEVPEFLVVPVTDGLPAYLAWVRSSTSA